MTTEPTSRPAAHRPAELTALLLIAGAVYGFLAERGVPNAIAALVALAAGAVPLGLSTLRDRRDDRAGWQRAYAARGELPDPSADTEQAEIDHGQEAAAADA